MKSSCSTKSPTTWQKIKLVSSLTLSPSRYPLSYTHSKDYCADYGDEFAHSVSSSSRQICYCTNHTVTCSTLKILTFLAIDLNLSVAKILAFLSVFALTITDSTCEAFILSSAVTFHFLIILPLHVYRCVLIHTGIINTERW